MTRKTFYTPNGDTRRWLTRVRVITGTECSQELSKLRSTYSSTLAQQQQKSINCDEDEKCDIRTKRNNLWLVNNNIIINFFWRQVDSPTKEIWRHQTYRHRLHSLPAGCQMRQQICFTVLKDSFTPSPPVLEYPVAVKQPYTPPALFLPTCLTTLSL